VLKETSKVGMKIRIGKLDRTERESWTSRHKSSHVGLTGIIKEIHHHLPAINVEIYDSDAEEKIKVWFHMDDLQAVDDKAIKEVKQEVKFDPNNLVVGV